jgi:hypothetical protein
MTFLRQLQLYGIALNTHGIAADLDTWIVGPSTVADTETPGVPRAGDNLAVEVSARKRRVWGHVSSMA